MAFHRCSLISLLQQGISQPVYFMESRFIN
jgi:hypothetical protein